MQDFSDALIAPSNQQDIANLKDKLQDLEQIDIILGANNLLDYRQKRVAFEAWLLTRGYTQAHGAKLDELFDHFKFEDQRRQLAIDKVFLEFLEAYGNDARMQDYFTETEPPARLWQFLCLSFQSIHDKKFLLVENVRHLIHLQKSRLQEQLAAAETKNQTGLITPPPIINTSDDREHPRPPYANPDHTAHSTDIIQNPPIAQSRYPDLKTLLLLVSGSGLIGLSFFQILSPKFALLLGVHFSPIMLLFLSLAGVALAAYGINRHLTQTTDNETQADIAGVNQHKRCWDFCFKFGGTAKHANDHHNTHEFPSFL